MRANELRIGNFVNVEYHGSPEVMEVVGITDYDMIEVRIGKTRLAVPVNIETETKPIPLTEEWLKKLNFQNCTNETDLNRHYTLTYNDFVIHFEVAKDICYGHVNATYVDHVNYVHQLQNLYFSLTGNELQIQQP